MNKPVLKGAIKGAWSGFLNGSLGGYITLFTMLLYLSLFDPSESIGFGEGVSAIFAVMIYCAFMSMFAAVFGAILGGLLGGIFGSLLARFKLENMAPIVGIILATISLLIVVMLMADQSSEIYQSMRSAANLYLLIGAMVTGLIAGRHYKKQMVDDPSGLKFIGQSL